jgi:hypothetical protein
VCALIILREMRVWVGEKRGWVCSGILLFTSNQNGAAGRKEAWEAACQPTLNSRAPRPPEHTHTHAPPSNAALFHSATHTTCTRASTRVDAPAASSVLAAASRVTRRRRYCRRHCAAALLLHHDVDDVAVLHVEILRRLGGVDAVAVEEEAHAVHRDAVAVAEGLQGESTGECEQRRESLGGVRARARS